MWTSNSHVFCKTDPKYINKILLRELVGALISTALLGIYIRLMYACGIHVFHMLKKGALFLAYFGIGDYSYHQPAQWKAALSFFLFAFSLGLNLAQFFLSLNRLSAFILVLNYERVWNTLFPYLCVFTFVVPSLIDYNQIAFFVGITLVISSLLVNGLTICLFVRHWTSSTARNNNSQSHRFSLILICLLDTIVPLLWELDYF
ncbi:hypothetical protein M3Y96_00601900 [Aphelenchoides besseyi]|nr:hypothetical protein M3Y96_00601900 [Aphelenchoides besseyi]